MIILIIDYLFQYLLNDGLVNKPPENCLSQFPRRYSDLFKYIILSNTNEVKYKKYKQLKS